MAPGARPPVVTSRVRRVRLDVDLPATLESAAPEIRCALERDVLHRALAVCERLVTQRWGEGVRVYISRLRLAWELESPVFDPQAVAERWGGDLAQTVLALVGTDARASGAFVGSTVAWFQGEGAWRGAFLLGRARGDRPAFCFRTLAAEADPWRVLLDRPAEVVAAAVDFWRAEGAWSQIDAHLEQQPALQAALRAVSGPPRTARGSVAPSLSDEAPAREPVATAVPLSAAAGPSPEEAPDRRAAGAIDDRVMPPTGAPRQVAARGAEPPPAAEVERRPALADAASEPRLIDGDTATAAGQPEPPARAAIDGGDTTAADASRGESVPVEEEPAEASIDTSWGGLFFFAKLINDLEIAEHLYCAGVREGDFLVHVFAAMVGSAGARDPAPCLLGTARARPRPPLRPVPAWAVEEVESKATATLLAHLRHHGGSVDPDELVRAVDTWARDLRPAAAPDRLTGRLVAGLAARLAVAFERRLGQAIGPWESLRRRLAIPATVTVPDPARAPIVVRFPSAALDIDLRLAGLDFNPGRLPWLDRPLALVFGDPLNDAV